MTFRGSALTERESLKEMLPTAALYSLNDEAQRPDNGGAKRRRWTVLADGLARILPYGGHQVVAEELPVVPPKRPIQHL